MEQHHSRGRLTQHRSTRPAGDATDPLANVRSIAECLDELSRHRQRSYSSVPAAEPAAAIPLTSTPFTEELHSC